MYHMFCYFQFLQSSHCPPPSPTSHRSSSRSSLCLQEMPPYHQASLLPGVSSLVRVKCTFSHWGQTQQSSAVCVSEASDQLVHAAWFVAQSVSERSQGSRLVETAGLLMESEGYWFFFNWFLYPTTLLKVLINFCFVKGFFYVKWDDLVIFFFKFICGVFRVTVIYNHIICR